MCGKKKKISLIYVAWAVLGGGRGLGETPALLYASFPKSPYIPIVWQKMIGLGESKET